MFISKFKTDDDDDYKVMHEGGDEPEDADQDQKPRKGRSQKEKYADDLENFNAKDFNRERGCTDLCFLAIFICFLGSMIFLTYVGYQKGDVKKLLAPLDGDLKFCGVKVEDLSEDGTGEAYDYTDYPYLMITDFSTSNAINIFSSGVCVEVCPQFEGDEPGFMPTGTVAALPAETAGYKYLVKTHSVMGICIPQSIESIPGADKQIDAILAVFDSSAAGASVADIQKASKAVNYSLMLSVVWCLVFIYLMSFMAEQLIWACVVLVKLTLLFVTGGFGYMLSLELKKRTDGTDAGTLVEDSQELTDLNQKILYLYIFTSVSAVITLIYMCLIFCNCTALKKAIDVIDAASDFLAKTPLIVLTPMLFFVLQIVAVKIWLVSYFCVISMNKIEAQGVIPQMKTLEWETEVKWMAAYMFFGILWVTAWLEYMCKFIIMVSATTYYFNSNGAQGEEGSAEVGTGYVFAIMHTGSLAIAAFIIAIVRFIRAIFYYIARKAEESSGDNFAVKAIVRCAECVLWCIEKICDYINSSALAYQAVTGDDFCESAWAMLLLQIKYIGTFTFANFFAKVFIFMGKVSITGANLYTCYAMMKAFGNLDDGSEDRVSSTLPILVIVGGVTYLAATVFLSILETAVLSMLTSHAIDLDVNKGEPKYGPPTFYTNVVNKKNDDEAATNDLQ